MNNSKSMLTKSGTKASLAMQRMIRSCTPATAPMMNTAKMSTKSRNINLNWKGRDGIGMIRPIVQNDDSNNLKLLSIRRMSTIHSSSTSPFSHDQSAPKSTPSSLSSSFSYMAALEPEDDFSRDGPFPSSIDSTNSNTNERNKEEGSGHEITTFHNRHCHTCICEEYLDSDTITTAHQHHQPQQQQQQHTCQDTYQTKSLPLPPPLPEPKYSYHRRILPPSLTQLSSPAGKRLFAQSLSSQRAEAYFPLSEQFLNQSHPAYCGITSLVMVLNAMGVDPNKRWQGGWRWYGNEDMILEGCCIDEERVRRVGILLEEFESLGRCQGLNIVVKRPFPPGWNGDGDDCKEEFAVLSKEEKGSDDGDYYHGLNEFRRDLIGMVRNPPVYDDQEILERSQLHATSNDEMTMEGGGGGFMVASFARSALHQTGEGHFSPIAAYHEETDQCLVMDVARFKYAPYWVSVEKLYEAMKPLDEMTGKSRGWYLIYPPDYDSVHDSYDRIADGNDNGTVRAKGDRNERFKPSDGYRGVKTVDERMRPADLVPLAGDNTAKNSHVCPIGEMKVEYCKSATWRREDQKKL